MIIHIERGTEKQGELRAGNDCFLMPGSQMVPLLHTAQ